MLSSSSWRVGGSARADPSRFKYLVITYVAGASFASMGLVSSWFRGSETALSLGTKRR